MLLKDVAWRPREGDPSHCWDCTDVRMPNGSKLYLERRLDNPRVYYWIFYNGLEGVDAGKWLKTGSGDALEAQALLFHHMGDHHDQTPD